MKIGENTKAILIISGFVIMVSSVFLSLFGVIAMGVADGYFWTCLTICLVVLCWIIYSDLKGKYNG